MASLRQYACAAASALIVGAGAAQQAEATPTFGVSDGVGGAALANTVASRLAEVGAVRHRLPVSWAALKPTAASAYQWTQSGYDTYLEALAAAGVHPVLTLNYTPSWAQNLFECPNTIHCPPAQNKLGDWAAFVTAVVARYSTGNTPANGGHNVSPAAIEVWNEPNRKTPDWNTIVGPDSSRYGTLLTTAYNASKAANPSLPVYSGSITDEPNVLFNAVNPMTWMTGLQGVGAQNSFDVLGVHMYPSADPNTPDTTPLNQTRTGMANFRAAAAAVGRSGVPIAITETGFGDPEQINGTTTTQAGRLLTLYNDATAMQDVIEFDVWRLGDTTEVPHRGITAGGPTFIRKQGFCDLKAVFNPGSCTVGT